MAWWGKKLAFWYSSRRGVFAGKLNFTDPNYDFLGNSINYSIASIGNDKPDQGYENTVVSASIAASFEQYRDVSGSHWV